MIQSKRGGLWWEIIVRTLLTFDDGSDVSVIPKLVAICMTIHPGSVHPKIHNRWSDKTIG